MFCGKKLPDDGICGCPKSIEFENRALIDTRKQCLFCGRPLVTGEICSCGEKKRKRRKYSQEPRPDDGRHPCPDCGRMLYGTEICPCKFEVREEVYAEYPKSGAEIKTAELPPEMLDGKLKSTMLTSDKKSLTEEEIIEMEMGKRFLKKPEI